MKDKPRNPVARSPLMKKGGVHEKSRSAVRQREKDAVKSELDEWEGNKNTTLKDGSSEASG